MSRVNTKNRKITRMPVNLRMKTIEYPGSNPKKTVLLNKRSKGQLEKNCNKSSVNTLNKTEDLINRAEENIVSNFIDSLFDDDIVVTENKSKKIPKMCYKTMENSPKKDTNSINIKNGTDNKNYDMKGIRKKNSSRGNNKLKDINNSEVYKIEIEINNMNKNKQLCEEKLRKVNEQISLLQRQQIELNQELQLLQKKENELNNKLKEIKEKEKNQEKIRNQIKNNKKEDENKGRKRKKEEKKDNNIVDKGEEAEDLIKFFNRNADMNEMAFYPFAEKNDEIYENENKKKSPKRDKIIKHGNDKKPHARSSANAN